MQSFGCMPFYYRLPSGGASLQLLLPLQPKHFKLRIPIQLIFRKFLGQYIALSRAVKLQGIPVFLHVGQIAGQGGLLAFKFGLAVP